MSEFDKLKARKDEVLRRERENIAQPLKARIAELEEVVAWIASQQNLFFAECSQAEEIIVRCKKVMGKAEAR